MPAHREIGSAGTSAGDAEYRLVGKGGASPIYGAMKARAKISPKPNIRPLMKGKPILMATTAVNRRARRFHERPCEKMKESVSSPVGAGGKGGGSTLIWDMLSSIEATESSRISEASSSFLFSDAPDNFFSSPSGRSPGCLSRPTHCCTGQSVASAMVRETPRDTHERPGTIGCRPKRTHGLGLCHQVHLSIHIVLGRAGLELPRLAIMFLC